MEGVYYGYAVKAIRNVKQANLNTIKKSGNNVLGVLKGQIN